MIKCFAFVVLIFCLTPAMGNAQKVIEFGIKPTELLWLNFEGYFAIGNKRARYGILFSYRPNTQDSGLVKSSGTGLAGGYGQNYLNKLYTSYTLGVYQKTYLNKAATIFLEADVFYRNWNFKNKFAEFNNVEGYHFKGVRTEDVDVWCIKLLTGVTLLLTKRERKFSPYIDCYAGIGVRYKEETYETFNGFVSGTYYSYRKDKFFYTPVTPQVGIKVGLIRIYK